MSRFVVLALGLLVACTGREREGAAHQPADEPPPAALAEPPLVTLELGLVANEAREQLAARHGPDSPLARADLVLAVRHRIEPPWHIYWQNPGDSGLRTELSFDSAGLEAGPVVYPGPDRFVADGGQVTYGWERDAVLFVPLRKIDEDARVQLRSDWLACHESCIPGHTEVAATIAELDHRDDALTRAMLERIPEPAGERLRASWTGSRLHVEGRAPDVRLLQFFPYASDEAVLVDTTATATALDLDYRFDAPPPADLGQGVVTIQMTGETRWLELAVSWPSS